MVVMVVVVEEERFSCVEEFEYVRWNDTWVLRREI